MELELSGEELGLKCSKHRGNVLLSFLTRKGTSWGIKQTAESRDGNNKTITENAISASQPHNRPPQSVVAEVAHQIESLYFIGPAIPSYSIRRVTCNRNMKSVEARSLVTELKIGKHKPTFHAMAR